MILRYIYRTTNLINQKTYIGQSVFKDTKNEHNYLGSGKLISKAIKKYGKENFKKDILHLCHMTLEEADNLEKQFISLEKQNNKGEYNLHEGGRGRSENAKQKISLSNKGKKFTDLHKKRISENHADVSGENNPMYGIAPKVKGAIWYTNGIEELLTHELPPKNWYRGRKPSPLKNRERVKLKNRKWFNNGEIELMCFECPKNFVSGRLKC